MNVKFLKWYDIVITLILFLFVFVRFFFAGDNFSYDYYAYMDIIDAYANASLFELFSDNFIFPYFYSVGTVPIEFGFGFVVNIIGIFGFSSSFIYALLAAFSIALKVYVMRSISLNWIWILWVSSISITLFEANALRLGVASSLFIYSIFNIYRKSYKVGIVIGLCSILVHIQILIFALPFWFMFLFNSFFNRTRFVYIITVCVSCAVVINLVQFLQYVDNVKIQEYINRGGSLSAGIGITTSIAIVTCFLSILVLSRNYRYTQDIRVFSSILLAVCIALTMYVWMDNVAVIGDRAWQLAFIIYSSLFWLHWSGKINKSLIFIVLVLLSFVINYNILYRYPLSNFFSPPLPSILIELGA